MFPLPTFLPTFASDATGTCRRLIFGKIIPLGGGFGHGGRVIRFVSWISYVGWIDLRGRVGGTQGISWGWNSKGLIYSDLSVEWVEGACQCSFCVFCTWHVAPRLLWYTQSSSEELHKNRLDYALRMQQKHM